VFAHLQRLSPEKNTMDDIYNRNVLLSGKAERICLRTTMVACLAAFQLHLIIIAIIDITEAGCRDRRYR